MGAALAQPIAGGVAESAAREFAFSREDFDAIAAVLRAEAGIEMPPAKEPLVYGRLAKRLRALGLDSFRDYIALTGEPGSAERQAMIAALTTNVTRFFREPHHFEDLRRRVLPPLMERARAGGRVRLWSAGCSTGMEPYSIGLCVLEALPDAASRDVRILATDINPHVLAEGAAGRYPADALRDAPADLRDRFFETEGDGGLRACAALRGLVAFKQLNLMGEWPMRGPFDVVFCRNVAIYFDEETQRRVWARIAALVAPGGRLCIGHSERISGPAAEMLSSDGVTSYVRTTR